MAPPLLTSTTWKSASVVSEARSVMLARRPRLALGGIAAPVASACNEAMEIYFLSDQGQENLPLV